MKIYSIIIGCVFALCSYGQANDIVQLKNDLKEYKAEAKENLDGKRYDGSKTTYVTAGRETEYKEVEVVLFLRDDYTVIVNGKGAPGKTNVRFFDKPGYSSDRIMLKEYKAINGKIITQNTNDLNELNAVMNPGADRLRSVYVEYEFKKVKAPKRGGMVLVLGY